MPTATVTVRELKNKDTGVDLTIPTYQESPGLLQNTVEYNVVVVSRLQCFKSPKHKESDVVQFMIPKQLSDFDTYKQKLSEKFPGTVLPPIPKKALLVNEMVLKERRSSLEHFLKAIAKTPKLITSHVTLEFLGVNPIKAGKFRKEEGFVSDKEADRKDIFEEQRDPDTDRLLPSQQENLFGEVEEEEVDLFADSARSRPETTLGLDVTAGEPVRGDTKLFEDQDLGGGLLSGDQDDFLLVPGARDTAAATSNEDLKVEDNSDLLNIEDDLDKFLKVEKKKESTKPQVSQKPLVKPKSERACASVQPQPHQSTPPAKPTLAPKPGRKPPPPAKPKPSPKPGTAAVEGKAKPVAAVKPVQAVKPMPEPVQSKPEGTDDLFAMADSSATTTMDTDDILKYIQENDGKSTDEDLDLFS